MTIVETVELDVSYIIRHYGITNETSDELVMYYIGDYIAGEDDFYYFMYTSHEKEIFDEIKKELNSSEN